MIINYLQSLVRIVHDLHKHLNFRSWHKLEYEYLVLNINITNCRKYKYINSSIRSRKKINTNTTFVIQNYLIISYY